MTASAPVVVRSGEAKAGVRRIRVLHLIHSVGHGGIESAVLNWVGAFDRTKYDIHVACLAGDRDVEAPFLRAAGAAGLEVRPIDWNRRKPFVRAARQLADMVNELGIDIVHTHAYYADIIGALTRRMCGVKAVCTVYVWGNYELKRRLIQWVDRIAVRSFDHISAHCDDTAAKMSSLGVKPDSTLAAGFPLTYTRPAEPERLAIRRAAGIADDETVLVYLARIHPEKAHDQLLRSFATIHAAEPKTRLWIYGVGFPEIESMLRQLCTSLDLDSAVEFRGFAEDIWPVLTCADIMTHPSHVEGVAVAILSGMAAELPIVVSNVGGIKEVIHHGRTGLLIDENDEDGFAAAVLGLIRDRDAARALGAGARAFIENEYSVAAAARRVESVYERLVAA